MNNEKHTNWGMKDIRAIRDRWAEMPPDEALAEIKRDCADELRRMSKLGKAKPRKPTPPEDRPPDPNTWIHAVRLEMYKKSELKKIKKTTKPRTKAHA